ncbi:hypothetical protein [Massilia sp. Mn16-1_5]|uniref:hypothetical protein n=1 Tax=Massilia sp. Mn16-1_5 TaxID=2079199 RepID=UPI00109EB0AE|nr:hypothetical protein [Massilia sp. Mn16-1_5]THC42448.1 hypothetical protein C2862_15505 [Massilia sp. Mn16-1_5]
MPVYVQHETLNRVSDVFNAEALWQAPGLALLNRRPLLRDLLERAPREQRGRAATRCFSHVTLVLPQDEVDDDRHLTRGARVRDLAQTLQALHQKDFGDLLGPDEVRYHVLGSEALQPGQVEVKFGHAVYLPAPNEEVQYTVSVSRDSAIWQPVCPIYPNGRLTVLGADTASATHAVPGWPFAVDGSILLINDGPDAPLELQVRPKEAFECSFDPAAGYYTIRARAAETAGTPARLLLKVTPAQAKAAPAARPASAPPAPRPPAVWKTRARSLDDAELTAVPVLHRAAPAPVPSQDATYAPVLRQRVSLVALALPRLSRYRDTGAALLEFGLAPDLAVGPLQPGGLLGFALDASDAVYAVTADGRQRITVPNRFVPRDGVDVRVLAPSAQMAERYSAIVCLPQAPGLPVTGGARHVFGRAAPMLAGLRVLDAGCLRGADGVDLGGADRLGLSRLAFGFEAGADGYRVTPESTTQALYHLDDKLGFVAAIAVQEDQPYLVPLGHHIVAGHYVLRVEA